jgi:hypothetical protein
MVSCEMNQPVRTTSVSKITVLELQFKPTRPTSFMIPCSFSFTRSERGAAEALTHFAPPHEIRDFMVLPAMAG